ncbi:unnamed protein product [Adineta steineri]|uniref:Ig-like domain-containing protein n=1 Tax=Adineta steineri TaxID=433720 RepID=A0A813VFV8_9BILA|nr:unnamed protein product [Adineta steineri]CAF3641563.1 unnamed protein product [Adineta steineri]
MAYSKIFLILFTVLNSIYYLNAGYSGVPQTTADTKAVLRRSLELRCIYDGDGSGEFLEWYRGDDDSSVNNEKSGHYGVKNNDKESNLTIKIFVEADAEVKKWYVKTKKAGYERPPECSFDQISLKASPQGMETDRDNEKLDSAHGSVRRMEDESVDFVCQIAPKENVDLSKVVWSYSKDDKTFVNLSDQTTVNDAIVIKDNELRINGVKKTDRGYYRCELNDVHFTVLLRVKDRLAALWPFLGIVGVVVVLVIIILIFEKRQKSNKKNITTDDDDQDQANDPLVRTTTKGSDNDNKKRAIKA